VIATGLGIGTLFTLFVVPAVYMVLSSGHGQRIPTQATAGDRDPDSQ
jgi:multidrug efflux pump